MARGKSNIDKLSELRKKQQELKEKERQLQLKVDTEIAAIVRKKLKIVDPDELSQWIDEHLELESMMDEQPNDETSMSQSDSVQY